MSKKLLSLTEFGNDFFPNDDNIERLPLDYKESPESVDSKNDKYGLIFQMSLKNTAQIKLFHWQSHKYGQHKALDEFFDGILDLGDKLAETVMGKYGVPVLNEEQLLLKLENFTDSKSGGLKPFLEKLYRCYSEEFKSLMDEKKDPELINIIDELSALVQQYKYLLELE